MSLLLIILLVIMLVVASILLIPIHVTLELLKDGQLVRGFYKVQWMGLTINQNEFPGEGGAEEKEVPEAKESSDRDLDHGSDRKNMLSMENMQLFKDALPSIGSTISDLLKCISLRRLDCDITMGMSDPVDTAIMSGYIWSASFALGGLWSPNLRLVPDFGGQRLDGSIMTELQVRLLMVAAAAIRALSREPLRKLIESLVSDSLNAKPQS